MMILKAEQARITSEGYNESKKIRDYMKSLNQAEQQKMHNIFNNIDKASRQGDTSIQIDLAYLSEKMLDMANFLGYKVVDSELQW